MAEIIEIREFRAARARAQRRRENRQSLKTAVALMRDNLTAAAERLRSTPEAAQPELLDRIEKLAAMVRYGMRMLEETEDETLGQA